MGYVTEGAVFFQEPVQKTVATSYVDNDISADIGSDDANGWRFQLVYDRAAQRGITVTRVTVYYQR